MYYRLSNTARRQNIEKEMGIPFRYPALYEPMPIINGLHEVNIPVVTMEDRGVINHAIWGILPEHFQDDWAIFQNIFNTLNLNADMLEDDVWYARLLHNRRCLIIATGFFTSYLHDGDIYPYYVYSATKKPLSLAGIYNQLDDGFITSSLLLAKSDCFIERIQNVERDMPVIISRDQREWWLDPSTSENDIRQALQRPEHTMLRAHPIAKEFYKNEISYKSMLEPVHYKDIPQTL